MSAAETRKTACILCYVNCGLEVEIQDRQIAKVRGDRDNPRSRGYLCQKAGRVPFYNNNTAHRLTTPLRRTPAGGFEPIDWDTAVREIAEKLNAIRAEHGGYAFGFYGGGGQGNTLGGPYGLALSKAMGSSIFYNALSQEKTGDYWVNGEVFGAQNCHTAEDVDHTDLLVVLGSNPWMANGFTRAREAIAEIRKDPARKLMVIDPRRTEVAEHADLHLRLRPGTDAFLLGAILALIVRRSGEDRAFIAEHTVGFDDVRHALLRIPVDDWIRATDVPRADVEAAVDLILAAPSMTVRVDVGLQQARNSTLNSYLEKLLFLVTGNFAKRGANGLHAWLAPLMGHSRPDDVAPVTGQLKIAGLLPPNTLPAQILTDHPERLRAFFVDSANPANSATNTALIEQAFRSLDLMVVIDVAMTETARQADYVLPAANQFEKWENTLFTYEYPRNYFHLRAPLFSPLEGTLVEGEIYTRILRAMGDLPDDQTLAELRTLAASDRQAFAQAFRALIRADTKYAAIAAVILYETLGPTLPDGAAAAAAWWLPTHRFAADFSESVRRAGIEGEGFELGENLFAAILRERSSVAFCDLGYEGSWSLMKHPDRRVRLAVPEMLDWLRRLDPADVAPDPDYPLMLIGGQRRNYNANQIIRDPRWRKTDPHGALHLHPDDLAAAGGQPGEWMVVETRIGRIVVKAEIDDKLRPGQASLPHGYGQIYDTPDGQVTVGPRLNILTDCNDCDPIAKTPYHKNVAIRVTRPTAREVEMMEGQAARLGDVV
ncbi:molybdopterin-dependent oxidoreductase [Caulobacter sp. KR2-114]|uniref:molybdopterin-dependent oxidoreductase n=1 Tax=Caulobacter sp. KR2-114 TaxID=3400912 RepID=UPI003C03540F